MIGSQIDTLIKLLARLPSLGPRSARRAVLYLIKKRETHLMPLITALNDVLTTVKTCPICGNLDTVIPCSICQDMRRDEHAVCVIQDVADLWALERSNAFRGRYHVLGGLLSAIDGTTPDDLKLEDLEKRLKLNPITEIILALPATIDGQTTAHYLMGRLKQYDVKISVLAQGIPIGGELDYLDDGTIQTAMKSRHLL